MFLYLCKISLFETREACCGTHVRSTGALEHFCILRLKSEGSGSRSVKAVAGPLARLARQAGDDLIQKITQLEEDIGSGQTQYNLLDTRVQEIKRQLVDNTDRILLPYIVKQRCIARLETMARNSRSQHRNVVKYVIRTLIDERKRVVWSRFLYNSRYYFYGLK